MPSFLEAASAALVLLLLLAALLWAATRPSRLRREQHREARALFCVQEDAEIVVLVPHRHREVFARYLLQELSRYFAISHPQTRFHVVAAQDTSDLPFSRGVSLNVALAYVASSSSPDQAVVVQDVDIVPRRNVSYECPPRGTVHIWWLNAGGMKGRLGDFAQAGGFSNLFRGWGGEETSFWHRLATHGIEHRIWYELDRPRGAVVLDLQGHDQAYWHSGENKSSDAEVLFVHQTHPEHGVAGGALLRNAPSPNWYDPEIFSRNEALKEYLDGLPPHELVALSRVDGLAAVDLSRVRSDDFFSGVMLQPNLRATNLVFDQAEVLGRRTPSAFQSHAPIRDFLTQSQM